MDTGSRPELRPCEPRSPCWCGSVSVSPKFRSVLKWTATFETALPLFALFCVTS